MNVIIDLHGVKHSSVENLIQSACLDYDPPFVVITGKSVDMKRLVDIAVKPFGLSTRDTIDNPGRVVVE